MTNADAAKLPRPFARLVGSNLLAQSAEQPSLAAAPLVAVLYFGAAPSALAVVLLSTLADTSAKPSTHRSPMQDLREGALFVVRHPLLMPIFSTQFIFNVASFILQAIYVPYAIRHLNLSASGVGITLACYGSGMVVGALCAPAIIARMRFGAVIAMGPVCGVIASILMASTIWIPHPALAGVAFFLLGSGPIVWVVSTVTLRQRVTPPAMLGRVSARTIVVRCC